MFWIGIRTTVISLASCPSTTSSQCRYPAIAYGSIRPRRCTILSIRCTLPVSKRSTTWPSSWPCRCHCRCTRSKRLSIRFEFWGGSSALTRCRAMLVCLVPRCGLLTRYWTGPSGAVALLCPGATMYWRRVGGMRRLGNSGSGVGYSFTGLMPGCIESGEIGWESTVRTALLGWELSLWNLRT